MKRVAIRSWAAAALLLALPAGYWLLRPRPARWRGCNVVWIISDALRRDALGCYGGDARTPHIDWLARNGVRFDNAYANAPCTLPSSLSMLTGRYASSCFIGSDLRPGGIFWVNDSDRLLAEVLRDKGYAAIMNVENPLAKSANTVQGFQEAKLLPPRLRPRARPNSAQGRSHPAFEGLLHYLDTVPKNRPFMMLNWFYDPHAPYNPPRRFLKRIPADPARLSIAADLFFGRTLDQIMKEFRQRGIPLSGADRAFLAALYRAEVESVDERIGRILDTLRRRDLLRRTIILFTADHGELLGEHGRWSHGRSFVQELVRVPLILYAPGLQSRTVAAPVAHVDLVPTLAEMLGAEPLSPSAQGASLLRSLGKGSPPPRPIYFSNARNALDEGDEIDGLLMDGFKLTAPRGASTRACTLFHLKSDPRETKDVSASEPAAQRRLFAVIRELRRKNERLRQANLDRLGPAANLDREREALLRDLRRLGYL